MPFPTALLGRYDGDLVAVALYAVVLAIAGVTEAVMFRHARGIGALTRPTPDEVYRHFMRTTWAPALSSSSRSRWRSCSRPSRC